jgi:hypothetical protein
MPFFTPYAATPLIFFRFLRLLLPPPPLFRCAITLAPLLDAAAIDIAAIITLLPFFVFR